MKRWFKHSLLREAVAWWRTIGSQSSGAPFESLWRYVLYLPFHVYINPWKTCAVLNSQRTIVAGNVLFLRRPVHSSWTYNWFTVVIMMIKCKTQTPLASRFSIFTFIKVGSNLNEKERITWIKETVMKHVKRYFYFVKKTGNTTPSVANINSLQLCMYFVPM